MVDVASKPETIREAVARCTVIMKPATLRLILDGRVEKGDVLGVARVAGIMAAKQTGSLIPMCHPLNIASAEIKFSPDDARSCVDIESRVRIVGRTGVEMEALTAAAVAALTIYDMCKAVDREMVISDLCLIKKSGGRSGAFVRSSSTSEGAGQ